MANPIPDLMVVNYKGSGNVQVYTLLNGITLGAQDGNDVVVQATDPILEVPAPASPAPENNHGNRLIEAFGKRFLLHGFRVYERNDGGLGNWGEVTGLGLSINSTAHSGLHLLHPNGVSTLAFFCNLGDTFLHVVHTTDGINWTDTTTPLNVGTINQAGPSIVFRNSIFWLGDGTDGIEVRQYDFVLENATEHNLPNADNKNGFCFHVHRGELFVAGPEAGSEDHTLWRLDGVVFSRHELVIANYNFGSVYGMWSDGDDIISVHQATTNGGFGNHRARRSSNHLLGDSISNVNAGVILDNCSNVTIGGFIPFVVVDPDPSPGQQRVYFWQRTGNLNGGTFNLFRFEYRQLPTGMHTGAFQVGEQVGDGSATGIVTGIVVDTSLSLTDVKGTWGAGPITGADSGATATSSGGLVEVAATALGTGIAGSNFGLPNVTDGGLDRIPTTARPEWKGLPTEILSGLRRRTIVVYGTAGTSGDIDIALYYSANSEAPDQRGTIAAISIADMPVTTGLVGNLGEIALEALSPSTGDAYVVSAVDGDGSLAPGGLSINEGDIVEYDGANWAFAADTTEVTAGVPAFSTHATLSTSTPLIAPYTDGADDGKIVAFDGTSQTGIVLSTPSVVSNEARNLTPSNGATTYNLDHNSVVDGFTSGDRLTLALGIV